MLQDLQHPLNVYTHSPSDKREVKQQICLLSHEPKYCLFLDNFGSWLKENVILEAKLCKLACFKFS